MNEKLKKEIRDRLLNYLNNYHDEWLTYLNHDSIVTNLMKKTYYLGGIYYPSINDLLDGDDGEVPINRQDN